MAADADNHGKNGPDAKTATHHLSGKVQKPVAKGKNQESFDKHPGANHGDENGKPVSGVEGIGQINGRAH